MKTGREIVKDWMADKTCGGGEEALARHIDQALEEAKSLRWFSKMHAIAKVLGIQNLDEVVGAVEVLKKDLADLREHARLTGSPHNSPDGCPTYYDGCHCTVDALAHNIERAEKAEASLTGEMGERDRLREGLKWIADGCISPSITFARMVLTGCTAKVAFDACKEADRG